MLKKGVLLENLKAASPEDGKSTTLRLSHQAVPSAEIIRILRGDHTDAKNLLIDSWHY